MTPDPGPQQAVQRRASIVPRGWRDVVFPWCVNATHANYLTSPCPRMWPRGLLAVGHTAVLAVLGEHGADLTIKDDRGITAAWCAINRDTPDVLRYLATRGVVDVERPLIQGLPPLHVACAMGKLAVVKFFATERGADVNSFYGHHSTPLLVALLGGEADVVRCEACLRIARTVNGISLTRAFAGVHCSQVSA